MIMEFDGFKLWLVLANLSAANIPYVRAEGAGKELNADVGTLSRRRSGLDCSGFVRYVLYHSTYHGITLNGGSIAQREWLEVNKFRNYEATTFLSVKAISNHQAAKTDGCVRIGFRDTNLKLKKETAGQEGVGHVWLVINGRTYESTPKNGRHKGPKSFDWSVRTKDADKNVWTPIPNSGQSTQDHSQWHRTHFFTGFQRFISKLSANYCPLITQYSRRRPSIDHDTELFTGIP